MTLVMAWLDNADCSLYLASDSLLTSDDKKDWANGTKIFRLNPSNAHIAYCGDSFLSLTMIAQAIPLLQYTDVLSRYGTDDAPFFDAKTSALETHFNRILPLFPSTWGKDATLLFADYDNRKKGYRLFTLQFKHPKLLLTEHFLTPQMPYFCIGRGSAKADGLISMNKYTTTAQYFSALTNTILDMKIGSVGGVPQMVKLTPEDSQPVGFNWDISGKVESTLFGMPLAFSSDMSQVHFMDSNFMPSSYLRSGRVRRSL